MEKTNTNNNFAILALVAIVAVIGVISLVMMLGVSSSMTSITASNSVSGHAMGGIYQGPIVIDKGPACPEGYFQGHDGGQCIKIETI